MRPRGDPPEYVLAIRERTRLQNDLDTGAVHFQVITVVFIVVLSSTPKSSVLLPRFVLRPQS
jgi:hypothetical protein